MLSLRVLGGLAVQNGVEIKGAGGQRKSLLLVALVAASPAGISREKLLSYLWRDLDEERAQNALRQRLFALRRDLSEEALFLGTADLRLNPSVATVDLWDFEAALAASDLERATEAYGGPFLDGIYLQDAPELERWIEEQRSVLAAKGTRAFTAFASQATRNGNLAKAIAAWRRVVAFDPASASGTLGLMTALVDAKDAPGALTHYRMHTALLRDEFELEPDERVASFAASVRNGTARLRMSPTSSEAVAAAAPDRVRAAEVDAERREPPAAVAIASAPVRRWSTRRLAGVGAIAIAAIALAVWGIKSNGAESIGRAERAVADSIVRARRDYRTFIVLMSSMQGDSALRTIAYKIIEGSLAKDTLFTIRDERFVRAQMADMRVPEAFIKDPDSVAANARVMGHAIIRANVARFGAGFTVVMIVDRTDRDRKIATFSGQAPDSAALPTVLRQLTDSAAESLGRVSKELRVAHDARVTTPVAALLLQEAIAVQNNGNYLKAVAFARAATRADTNYLGAWDHLSASLSNADVRRAERLAAATRAYTLRHRGRLSGELWYAARWYAARGILDSAYESERRHVNYANFQGGIRRQQREWLLAELESRRMIGPAPGANFEYPNLVGELLNQGKFADADSVIRVMEARPKMTHFTIRSYISRKEAARDYDSAAVYILQSLADTATPAGTTLATLKLLRATRASQGRLRESDSVRRVVESELEKLSDPGSLLALRASQATLLLLVKHDTVGARQLLAEAIVRYPVARMEFMDRPFPALISAYTHLGDLPRARALLQEWDRGVPPEYRKVDARQLAESRGELALAEGKFAEALRHFRTDRTGPCAPCDAVFIARTFDAMRQADSASFYFSQYLDTPATGRWDYDTKWLAYAYDRAAALHAGRGETEQALQRIAALASLWKNADPELRNGRLAELKRRADVLRRGAREVAKQ